MLHKRDYARAGIIAAKAVQTLVFRLLRIERIFRPARSRLDSVDMGVEQQSWFVQIKTGSDQPQIIPLRFTLYPAFSQLCLRNQPFLPPPC